MGPDGNVYVSDSQNHRIQVFSPTGSFLRMWGQSGTSAGQVFNPGDVTTTPAGNLAVLDGTSRVQEFRVDGTFVRELGDAHLRDNADVAFGPSGAMYVSGYLASLTRGIAKYGIAAPSTPTPPSNPSDPGASQVGQIKVSKKPVKVRKRTVSLRVVCPESATEGCRGVARIRVGKKAITTKRGYSVTSGKTAQVKLKVTRKGMRKVKRKPTVAMAELSAPGATKPSVTKKIKIRR